MLFSAARNDSANFGASALRVRCTSAYKPGTFRKPKRILPGNCRQPIRTLPGNSQNSTSALRNNSRQMKYFLRPRLELPCEVIEGRAVLPLYSIAFSYGRLIKIAISQEWKGESYCLLVKSIPYSLCSSSAARVQKPPPCPRRKQPTSQRLWARQTRIRGNQSGFRPSVPIPP